MSDKYNELSNPNPSPNWNSLACQTLYQLTRIHSSQNWVGNLWVSVVLITGRYDAQLSQLKTRQSCSFYSFTFSWFNIYYFMISWTWWTDLKRLLTLTLRYEGCFIRIPWNWLKKEKQSYFSWGKRDWWSGRQKSWKIDADRHYWGV